MVGVDVVWGNFNRAAEDGSRPCLKTRRAARGIVVQKVAWDKGTGAQGRGKVSKAQNFLAARHFGTTVCLPSVGGRHKGAGRSYHHIWQQGGLSYGAFPVGFWCFLWWGTHTGAPKSHRHRPW